ncbi:MAG: BolA family protein [Alphaproteobacteria bacterium]
MDDLIKQLIEENFNPVEFELINESYKHLGHVGDDGSGQTHYKLIVVSEMFQNCSRIDRQRAVMQVLSPAFSKGLHAVSVKLSSPGE